MCSYCDHWRECQPATFSRLKAVAEARGSKRDGELIAAAYDAADQIVAEEDMEVLRSLPFGARPEFDNLRYKGKPVTQRDHDLFSWAAGWKIFQATMLDASAHEGRPH